MAFLVRALGLASALALGCSPSAATLVREQRWDDAICAVHDARDARVALPAIVAGAKTRFRVRELRPEELRLDPAQMGDFFVRHTIVVFDGRSNVRGVRVDASPSKQEPSIAGLGDVARLTGESVPSSHQETRTVVTEYGGLLFFTLGVSALLGPLTRTETVTVEPTALELAKSAPRASAIYAAVQAKTTFSELAFVLPAGGPWKVLAVVRLDDADTDRCWRDHHEIVYEVEAAAGTWYELSNFRWKSMTFHIGRADERYVTP